MNTTPPNAEELKALVREKYAAIVEQSKDQNETSCCGATSCGTSSEATGTYTIMSEDYTQLPGYVADADLGLGCGLPTEFARMKEGDTVLDLGSGAGNDCFVARSVVGDTGKVIGVDMTEKMVDKARSNAQARGYTNVEFHLGEIEDLPLASNKVDVVVSNCVLNLVPNKAQAFVETFRVLKPGGHFSISDIVLVGELPAGLQEAAEMYAGCVSGAIQKEQYLQMVAQAGFTNIGLQKQRLITLPDEILASYLTEQQVADFKASGTGIYSITVYAEKPKVVSCAPHSGCC